MTNNDIIRRLRYLFQFKDQQVVDLFALAEHTVTKAQVNTWLKKEEDPEMVEISDRDLAVFLNGLIIDKRGRREGPLPEPEDPLTNNMIFKKIQIAMNLSSDDIIAKFKAIDKTLSKHELSAFFRKPNHKSYRYCMDQYLRNFIHALQTAPK
ncbi:DUF1456 family protein [Flavobacteriaceae bacterium]|nr:DUF1456 family protein [Flavobacteriaceae bacterium]